MKKKELELILQKTYTTNKVKYSFEQYMTPASIASDMLWRAFFSEDIVGKVVLDAGCGTGIFSIGAALLNAKETIGVDIDSDILSLAKKNAKHYNLNIHFHNKDFNDFNKTVDTVIMNPPFGAQYANRKADSFFIKKALSLAYVIYSLHLKNSIEHIISLIEKYGWSVHIIKEYKFPIPAIFNFHKKPKSMFDVSYIKATKK